MPISNPKFQPRQPSNICDLFTFVRERWGEEEGEGGGEEGKEGQQAQNRINCAKSMSPN